MSHPKVPPPPLLLGPPGRGAYLIWHRSGSQLVYPAEACVPGKALALHANRLRMDCERTKAPLMAEGGHVNWRLSTHSMASGPGWAASDEKN